MRRLQLVLAVVSCLSTAASSTPSFAEDEHGGAPPLERLFEALRGGERWTARMEAALLLGRSGDLSARRPLERALLDEHYAVRAASARALAHLGDARALPPLFELLTDDEPLVRSEARRALDRFSLAEAQPHLVAALRTHPDARVRLFSAERLRERPTAETVAILLDATGGEDEVARFCASALAALPRERALEAFLSGLGHGDYRVQLASLAALAELEAVEAAEPVVQMLDARLPEVTLAAARTLRALAPRLDRETWRVRALRADRFERARALKVLGALGGEDSVRLLLGAMADPDVLVRGAAVSALFVLGDPRAIPRLRQMKKDEANARIISLVRLTLGALERQQALSASSPAEGER
jgi:HEAT repeat protein